MGVLYFRRDQDSNPQSSQRGGENITPFGVDPWLVVVIAIGILIILTLGVFMLAHYIKSRYTRRKGFRPIEEKNQPYYARKRESRSSDLQEVEDLERDMMIRKSLASRTSLTTSPPISHMSLSSDGDHHLEHERTSEASEEQGETVGLKDDWKAWEARVTDERRTSHPGGLGLDQHPAFAPYLSVPQPALPAHGGSGPRRLQALSR
ncbi:hypothetical protein GGR51DRAFT_563652 [Nemania sp. FL0031]|nr:hypothetical protein GGR51DRAFT_563652 [Nemania sp. FL0031]